MKGLLSIICGPLVEATFNLIDDCMEEDQRGMTQQNLEAKLKIKYFCKSRRMDTANMEITAKMRQKVLSTVEIVIRQGRPHTRHTT